MTPKKAEQDTTDTQPAPWAEYALITDAPPHLRRLDDVPLSAEQMTWINRRAHELREETTVPDRVSPEGEPVKGGTVYTENLKAARLEFKAAHAVEDGQWLPTKKDVN